MSGLVPRRPHRRKNPDESIRRNDNGHPFGNRTVFTPDQEKGFVKYLHAMKTLRLPRTKKTFELDIQFFVNYCTVPNPFTHGLPGYYWTMRFMKDNNVTFLTDAESKLVSDKILKVGEFIEECVTLVKMSNGGELLDSGKRLLILDMKMFLLDGNVKVAVLLFGDVEGKLFKPIVIHDSNLSKETVAMFGFGITFTETSDGDLDKATLNYVLYTIASAVEINNVTKPVCVLVGYEIAKQHTLVTWLTTVGENIVLLPMPSCINDIYDSMDLGLFVGLVPLIHRSLKMRFSQPGRAWTAAAFTQVLREHTKDLIIKPVVKEILKRFGLEALLYIPKKPRTSASNEVQRLDIRDMPKRRSKLECVLETDHLTIKVFK